MGLPVHTLVKAGWALSHRMLVGSICRLVRDPDRCQGYAAMSDVCAPGALPVGEARVELRAGDAGLRSACC